MHYLNAIGIFYYQTVTCHVDMTNQNVSVCSKPPTVMCHNLTAVTLRSTNTSFLLTPHYIRPQRNLDNLHNAVSVGYSLVWIMAEEHLVVVLC